VANDLQGLPLLLVQQDDEGRRTLRELAEQLGMVVQETADAGTVPQLIAAGSSPMMVLLVERGREAAWLNLARTLRRQDLAPGVLLCHVTFLNGDTDVDLFDGHMNKPVTLESLHDGLLAMSRAFRHPGAGPAADIPAEAARLAPAKPRRVLVAEDNRINALVIRSFLEQAGHRVVLVENGADALTVLARGGFDVVLMDMRMPQVDGLEATRRWRAQEAPGRHIPIIALTANATVEDRERCLAAGMDDFLSKPVEQVHLLDILARLGG
jgi:CheY-like chemotaxis protein